MVEVDTEEESEEATDTTSEDEVPKKASESIKPDTRQVEVKQHARAPPREEKEADNSDEGSSSDDMALDAALSASSDDEVLRAADPAPEEESSGTADSGSEYEDS
jgi:hypothetical protein